MMQSEFRTTSSPRLLSEKEAARELGFSIRTLQKWRYEGRGPKFLRLPPRTIRYRQEDLDQWIEACVRTSTSERGNA